MMAIKLKIFQFVKKFGEFKAKDDGTNQVEHEHGYAICMKMLKDTI